MSLLSLKGMCTALPSESLAMTVPRVSRLLLMKDPSWRWLLLREARADSEPAGFIRSRQSTDREGCHWVASGKASGLKCANKLADAQPRQAWVLLTGFGPEAALPTAQLNDLQAWPIKPLRDAQVVRADDRQPHSWAHACQGDRPWQEDLTAQAASGRACQPGGQDSPTASSHGVRCVPAKSMRLSTLRVRATCWLGGASGSGRSLLSMVSRRMVWERLLPSL